MVGRRQLREKVIEAVYAHQQNPQDVTVSLKNMMSRIAKIYDLYVSELNFLIAFHELEQLQLDIAKDKFIKTEEDLNPNLKFVNNRILEQLIHNEERRNYTDKHQDLVWSINDELVIQTYRKIKAGKRYKDYMKSSENSFEEDQKFIGKLFLRYVAENEELEDFYEGKEISWADDFHISNSMIQKMIGFMKADKIQDTLIKVIKDEEDENFVKNLLSKTLTGWNLQSEELEKRLDNWDLDRVSLMDKIILITAMTELNEFKLTPSTIIMNEYIEIAKAFSSEKSNIFINGILDKYVKDHNRI